MAEGFKISRDDALGIYKATLKSYTQDGTMSRETQEKIINFQRKQLKVETEIAPESVYDFTMLRAINDEIKKAGRYRGSCSTSLLHLVGVITGRHRFGPRAET